MKNQKFLVVKNPGSTIADWAFHDAKFIPGTDRILLQGTCYESFSKNFFGALLIYDRKLNLLFTLTKDYGVYDYLSYHFLCDRDYQVTIDVSPDGSKAVYIANYRKKQYPDPLMKYTPMEPKYLAAYVINLDKPFSTPIKIADNKYYSSWLSWPPNGKYIIISREIYDAKTYKKIKSFNFNELPPCRIDFYEWSPDGNYLAVGSYYYNNKQESYVLHVPTHRIFQLPRTVAGLSWEK